MAEIIADVVQWMETMPPLWTYAVILGIAYGENIIPPIPGDMIVVFGGYLVGIGTLSFPVVVLLSTLGGALGFMTVYAAGYRFGPGVLGRMTWLPGEQVDKARAWIRKWGYGVVAANRFLSGARSVISLTVGMAHMDPWKTAGWATFSAAVWTTLITYAGYVVGENWEVVGAYLRTYGRIVLGVLLLIALAQLGRWYLRRKRERNNEAP